MSFQQIEEHCYYLPGKVQIGAVVKNGQALIIDSGIDAQAGKKIYRLADEQGWQIRAVLNTHSHADHIGGNAFLAEKAGAKIYAPRYEDDLIEQPIFESMYLTGGCYPWKTLRNKFFMAPESSVTAVFQGDKWQDEENFPGVTVTLTRLPGHTFNHTGFAVDQVLYCGDAFLGFDVLEGHGIPFNVDIERVLTTLDVLGNLPYRWYVPAHGPLLHKDELSVVLAANRQRIHQLVEMAWEETREPVELETVLASLCERLGKHTHNAGSYLLYRTSVTGLLSYLFDRGQVENVVRDNRLYWVQSGK